MATGDSNKTIFDKMSDAFETAITGVTDLLDYFKNIIRKCINSIAILLVTSVLTPIIVLLFFRWLLSELFGVKIPTPAWRKREKIKAEPAANEENLS